jgi:hypothetical protein
VVAGPVEWLARLNQERCNSGVKPGGPGRSLGRRALADSRLPIEPTAASEAAVIVPASTMEEPATTSRMRPDNDTALGFRRRRHRQQRTAQKPGYKD